MSTINAVPGLAGIAYPIPAGEGAPPKPPKTPKPTPKPTTIVGPCQESCFSASINPVEALEISIKALTPVLEVRSRRVGGATYQVPIEVRPVRSTTLALRWLVDYSRARREKSMEERLMNEILDASNGLGAAVKRREDTHKMAESNKAFAHYRW